MNSRGPAAGFPARGARWQGTRAHRRYVSVMAATLVLLGFPVLLNVAFLWRAGELAGEARVAVDQQARGTLYGTGLHGNDREHRLALIAARQPEVVVLGSSRMEQFRQDYFTAPFVCACTLMGAIEHGAPFVEAMFKVAKPKLVILGLDYWWFGDSPDDGGGRWRPSVNASNLSAAKLLRPFAWLRRGSLGIGDYLGVLTGRGDIARLTTHPKLGVQAVVRGRGVRKDGSALHADALFGPARQHKGQDFDKVRAQIAEGDTYYPHNVRLAPRRFAELERLVRRIEGHGAKVVVILPPLAGRVADMMKAEGKFAYVSAIRARLRRTDGEIHDFHDPRPLGAADCEFLDDRHGGDVVVMRMLERILRDNPGSALTGVVGRAKITAAIARFKGHALAPFRPALYRRAETDFLGLGCRKAARR
ncbi:MAG: hypothetical protein ACTSUD_12485 [Alphaproteobacteria bacterium]